MNVQADEGCGAAGGQFPARPPPGTGACRGTIPDARHLPGGSPGEGPAPREKAPPPAMPSPWGVGVRPGNGGGEWGTPRISRRNQQ